MREGFDNDEELAMYDLLLKDSFTSLEIKKIKKLAKVLLERIRDTLWSELPESYEDQLLNEYRRKIYEFVYTTYPAA